MSQPQSPSQPNRTWEQVCSYGKESLGRILQEASTHKLTVRHEGDIVLDVPVSVAVIGAVVAPRAMALGAVGAVLSHCSIELGRSETPQPVLDVREPG